MRFCVNLCRIWAMFNVCHNCKRQRLRILPLSLFLSLLFLASLTAAPQRDLVFNCSSLALFWRCKVWVKSIVYNFTIYVFGVAVFLGYNRHQEFLDSPSTSHLPTLVSPLWEAERPEGNFSRFKKSLSPPPRTIKWSFLTLYH